MEELEKLELFKNKGWLYNPETGDITSHKGKIIKGGSNGYILCGLRCGKKLIIIPGNRLAWYLYYNELPPKEVDHINVEDPNNRSNNRINNLRGLTHQKNQWNKNSKGYSWCKINKKWYSCIKVNYKTIYIGYFNTKEEARDAYLKAKLKYHNIDKPTNR